MANMADLERVAAAMLEENTGDAADRVEAIARRCTAAGYLRPAPVAGRRAG